MKRVTYELPESQYEFLRARARRSGSTVTAILREQIARLMDEASEEPVDVESDTLFRYQATAATGTKDLAENHDMYLYGERRPRRSKRR